MERLHKSIGDFLGSRVVPRVDASDTVAEAIKTMRELDAHCVFVEESKALVGVFTERDLVRRVAARGLDVEATPVGEVMTREPETLGRMDDVAYAINKMAVGGYRNIPIVDGGGLLEGAFSVHDVIEHLSEVMSSAIDDADAAHEWIDIGGGD